MTCDEKAMHVLESVLDLMCEAVDGDASACDAHELCYAAHVVKDMAEAVGSLRHMPAKMPPAAK